MTDYHFVSTWRLQAPIEPVWEEIFHTERWPSWWKYIHRVDQLDPGDAHGLGKRQHVEFTTRPPHDRNGYVFHQVDGHALESAMIRAIGLWHTYPDRFRELMTNGMRTDYSWASAGQHYLNVYDHVRHK